MTIPSAVEREVVALRNGSPAALIDWLRWPQEPNERVWWFLWHEVSTLVGRVVGHLQVEQDGVRHDGLLVFNLPVFTGGGPREIVDAVELGEHLARALEQPLGVEPHRRNVLKSLSDPHAFALLLHHTDSPVDLLDELPRVLPDLASVFGDAARFREHLELGLRSPSVARRDLSRRLLAFG